VTLVLILDVEPWMVKRAHSGRPQGLCQVDVTIFSTNVEFSHKKVVTNLRSNGTEYASHLSSPACDLSESYKFSIDLWNFRMIVA
jgi:hypothetical protein